MSKVEKWLREILVNTRQIERIAKRLDIISRQLSRLDHKIEMAADIDIVRCKECKHCYVDGEQVKFNACELNHNKVQSGDWFCADGEREGE